LAFDIPLFDIRFFHSLRYHPPMLAFLAESLRGLLDLALPRCCAACQMPDEDAAPLCGRCAQGMLAQVGQRYCPRCGATVAEGLSVDLTGCAHCPQPMPRFDRAIRLGTYDHPLADLIRRHKFRRAHGCTGYLAGLLAQRIAAEGALAGIELVQPVPLHWRRQWSRGYNQSALVAARLSHELHLPLGDELVRLRHTPPQTHLSRTARLQNVHNAFAVPRRRQRWIDGRHILLLDDVTTTGATASEAARALIAAGARRVSLAVLAKADPPRAFVPRHG
jgi:ComF family protein